MAKAVDTVLREQSLATEIRWLDETGEVRIEKTIPSITKEDGKYNKLLPPDKLPRLFLFGINRHRFEQQAKEIKITPNIVEKIADADLLLTSKLLPSTATKNQGRRG